MELTCEEGLFSHPKFFDVIFFFLFLAVFDTIGTLIGISEQAGFLDKEGKLPRGDKALQADAGSAVIGSVLGCSTITCYVESSAGVAAGARTGLANIFTGLMFLVAMFFLPLAESVGEGYKIASGAILYPAVAPALIVVGALMIRNITKVNWEAITDSIPAFLTLIAMPFTFSITEGISWGFISYTLLKVMSGKYKDIHWLVYIITVLFVLRYIFLIS